MPDCHLTALADNFKEVWLHSDHNWTHRAFLGSSVPLHQTLVFVNYQSILLHSSPHLCQLVEGRRVHAEVVQLKDGLQMHIKDVLNHRKGNGSSNFVKRRIQRLEEGQTSRVQESEMKNKNWKWEILCLWVWQVIFLQVVIEACARRPKIWDACTAAQSEQI